MKDFAALLAHSRGVLFELENSKEIHVTTSLYYSMRKLRFRKIKQSFLPRKSSNIFLKRSFIFAKGTVVKKTLVE